MIYSARSALSGTFIKIEFGESIQNIAEIEASDTDLWISPGFVDLQINGFGGVDFNSLDCSDRELGRSALAIRRTGVTQFLPTVITGPPAEMLFSLSRIWRSGIAASAGLHVEGPHIDPSDGPRGAHPAEWVRPPDVNEFYRWQEATDGHVRIVTLSAHWPESPTYIRAITAAGAIAAIGHTSASPDQIRAAVDAGARISTHIGNGAHRMLPSRDNYIWEQLGDDRLAATFIADGLHLGPAFLRAAVRAKGVDKSVLITDATSAASSAPGKFRLGRQHLQCKEDNRVVLADSDQLAGSRVDMSEALGNLVRFGAASLSEAVKMATINPANAIQLPARMRGLEVGERADLVLFRFNETLSLEKVYTGGIAVL